MPRPSAKHMPISYSAAGLPVAAAARSAGPPMAVGSAFAGCAAGGIADCVGAAMLIGPGIELVASADGVGAIRLGVGVGAIKLGVGVGATSGSVAVCRVAAGAGVAGTAGAAAAGGRAGAIGSASLR